MRYLLFRCNSTECDNIAEFDDIALAQQLVWTLTKDLQKVEPSDTEPPAVWYEITDSSTANTQGLEPDDADYDPIGSIVWSSDKYYND